MSTWLPLAFTQNLGFDGFTFPSFSVEKNHFKLISKSHITDSRFALWPAARRPQMLLILKLPFGCIQNMSLRVAVDQTEH